MIMPRGLRALSVTLFTLLASATLLAQDTAHGEPGDTVTLTGPAPNTVIAESDDYATKVLGNPWDMNQLDDLDWHHGFSAPVLSNGIWNATTRPGEWGASVHLQHQSFDNTYSYVGEQDGVNNPIDSNRFSRLWVRMYAQQPGNSVAWAFRRYEYQSAANSNVIQAQVGWHIYSIDLRQGGGGGSGTWTQNGPYGGLRFDPPYAGGNNNVQIDWARLTPDTGQQVSIAWNHTSGSGARVNLFLSYSPNAAEGNEYLLANVAASNGSYNWVTTGMAPGSYYIHAELNGAWSSIGPLHVNTTPLARIDAPSPASGEDYAYAVRASGWESDNAGQFQRVMYVNPLYFGPSEIYGVPTTNDPSLFWLDQDFNLRIDAAKYHYFNIRFKVNAPNQRPWAPYNAGTRLIWDSGDLSRRSTEQILAPYNTWVPAKYDLRQVEMADGGPNNWSGLMSIFRFDPLEEDAYGGLPSVLPASFQVDRASLMTDPVAGRAGPSATGLQGTIVRWTPLQGGGTVSVYYDVDRGGYNGTPIVTNVPVVNGWARWNTASVNTGVYWVYIVVSDGTSTSRFYSLAPIIVDHNRASTLFADVPPNYWAVDDINRLAFEGIVSGTAQEDSSALFRPAGSALRSHLSKMVVLAAGWPLINPSTPTFRDVAPGSTFYQYIETAAARGAISGYSCGGPGEPCPGRYFRPGNNVTRAQTAKMVVVSQGWPVIVPSSPRFADVPYDPSNASLYAYIETAASRGIISGYACGGPGEPCDGQNRPYYRPGNSVTRAQLSKMLSGALGAVQK
jgi:hypothetical protein